MLFQHGPEYTQLDSNCPIFDPLIDLFCRDGHNYSMLKHPTFMILGLLLVLLTGCGHLTTPKAPENPAPRVHKPAPKNPEVTKPEVETTAVWYSFSETQVALYLKNIDNGEARTMILQKGMSTLPLDEGHWELAGFEENGNSFTSMNTSKKFVFRVKPGANVYAGSLIIGCPKVSQADFKYLKAMRYFDRYPFSSTTKLCEMIIGNDFAFVRNQLRKTQKNKGLKLQMGF